MSRSFTVHGRLERARQPDGSVQVDVVDTVGGCSVLLERLLREELLGAELLITVSVQRPEWRGERGGRGMEYSPIGWERRCETCGGTGRPR